MAIVDYPNFFAPIGRMGANGSVIVDDVWYRRFQLQRQQVSDGFNLVVSPGLSADLTAVGPGDTLTLTNTGVRSLTLNQPPAGLAISTNGVPQTLDVVSTFALANDLAAVEGLSTFGFAVRSANDAWRTRTLLGTADSITVTDGDGVASSPVFSISPTYPGQTSITTLGTVDTGTWNADTIAILNGGTGQTTANSAFNALAPSQATNAGKFLQTDGTNTSWVATTEGTVTSVSATVPPFLSVGGVPITSSGTIAITLSGTALPVLNGGTGVTTSTGSGSVVLSTSPTLVAPVLGAATGTSLTLTGGGLQLDNAQYLRGKIAAGTSTRLIGINSSDVCFVGSIDAAISSIVLSVGGTTALQLTGSTATFPAAGTVTGGAFIPSSASIPTNGMYLPAANTTGVSANSTQVATFSTTQHKLIGIDLVVPKTQGKGIKVDTTTPTFGWRDLTAPLVARGIGPEDPTWDVFRGNIRAYQFHVGDEIWCIYHLPHDYVMGTDIYIHVHYAHTSATVTTGAFTWGFESTYAKGWDQAAFPATVTTTVAQNAATGAGGQYKHEIAETVISVAGGSATLLNSSNFEPDGLIMTRIYLSAETVDGGVNSAYLFAADCHYQTTGVTGTKSRSGPAFWT